MRSKTVTRAVQALLLVAVVAGTVGFVAFQKTVTLAVDGETRVVNTFAGDVAGVLDGQEIDVSEHDLVSPALDSPVGDGTTVTVRYARLLTLDIDGESREVWTTARNVDEALDQIGMRTDGAVLSASRSSSIGRDGLALSMRMPKTITIAADGAAEELTTTASTVADAIEEAGVALDGDDRIRPSLSTRLTDDVAIAVTRVTTETASQTIELPYATETRQDPNEYEDFEDVITAGAPGARVRDLRIVRHDGVVAYHVITADRVTAQPVNRVVVVGTKQRPAAPPSPPPGGGGSPGTGVWDQLAQCESGGNWSINTGNGYYGGLQFSYGTWLAYGGGAYGETANLATREQQIEIAERLRAVSGFHPWPSCARKLGLI
jgi:uncharacterized protein YabE (DUF348 family)